MATATTKHRKDSKPRPQGPRKRTNPPSRQTLLIVIVATAAFAVLAGLVAGLATFAGNGLDLGGRPSARS